MAAEQPSFSAEIKASPVRASRTCKHAQRSLFREPGTCGEPGTPLNPTPQMITQDLGTVSSGYQDMLNSYASRSNEMEQEPEKGQER